MTLPDFFVIGAPDAGSRALHEELGRQPGLFMSEIAEPGYFLTRPAEPDPDRTAGAVGGTGLTLTHRRDDYEALFDAAPAAVLRGESTPYYLADFPAQRRMHELLPYAKMIVLLRDPVDRAYAHWVRMRRAGLESIDGFERALAAEPARTAAGWAWPWRYLALGRYGAQLQRLHTLFARHQVLLVGYRDLAADPAEVARQVHRFLGVARGDGQLSGVGSTVRPAGRLADGATPLPGTAEFLDRATLAALRPAPRADARGMAAGNAAATGPAATGPAAVGPAPGASAPGGSGRFGGDGGPAAGAPEFGSRLDRELAARVREGFRPDIVLLSEVTRRRFDGWLTGGECWA